MLCPQVKAWLTNWQAAIEQQQSRLASTELLVQLQRQGEVYFSFHFLF